MHRRLIPGHVFENIVFFTIADIVKW